jgi:predicted flap endonuclease-1-like 5' DNA nuclease
MKNTKFLPFYPKNSENYLNSSIEHRRVREKSNMRSDYALYLVAIIIFIITGMSFALALAEFERNLWIVTTAILGLLFLGLGYSQRPKLQAKAIKAPPPTPSLATSPAPAPTVEVAKEEKPEIVVEAKPVPSMMELTKVKGIGEKRKEQLKTLNISSVEDLAKASAEDLASKLKISPKITGRWIDSAKQLLEKS